MPYYAAGDYYRGDYYRGDFFGGLKKLAGSALKIGAGFALGGPIGGVLAASPIARKVVGAIAPAAGKVLGLPGPLVSATTGTQMRVFSAIDNFGGGAQKLAVMPPATLPRLGPGPSPGPLFGGPLEGAMVMGRRYRRMNVTNVRALRRAGRRVKGFLKLARSLGALPVGGGKGKKIFKARRRR